MATPPTTTATTDATSTSTIRLHPRGAARQVLECRDFEILVEGPVGTGKTFAVLWKIHLLALKYPGMKALLLRKTQRSLTESAIQTYVTKILPLANWGVRPFSGNIAEPRSFRYPNGSRLVVGGLDNPGKVMSAEYDVAAIFEATQVSIEDWENVTTRLRNGVMPYQQLIGDCNPDGPTHWLNQRANDGKITRLLSRHQDNPRLWDADRQAWTPEGEEYVVLRLENLTGVRRKRNLEGLWAAAEGQVYEGWDPAIHVVDRFEIPADWPRYWSIDFGFRHPFIWQWWAEDHDGTLYRYREIAMTGRLVEDHARLGLQLSANEPKPTAIVTDHDAEDRATFERKTGYRTKPAFKGVSAGIQAVAERLRPQRNGKPRIVFLRDSLVELDPELRAEGRPTCTEDEFTSYVWNTASGRRLGEEPVKANDHGMDAMRYMVAFRDLQRTLAKARSL